mmetsp:Transcript_111403/g.359587  ORF Transcript_111403/g.359587 Transcript_111403/m.359587 type:complete len:697 (+) Transcript_111403:20-2110(+)
MPPSPFTASKEVLDRLVEGLAGPGFCVLDGFLGGGACQELQDIMRRSQQRGDLQRGKVGPSAETSVEDSLRTDVVMCVDQGWDRRVDALMERQDELIRSAAEFLPELTCGAPGGLRPAAVQCAAYPGGGSFYMQHVDNPGSDPEDRRRLTTVYYCNPGWSLADGGALRLHWADGAACAGREQVAKASASLVISRASLQRRLGASADVAPLGDRLVVFWSDHRMPHEVLPSHAVRYAVSAWWAAPEAPGTKNPLYAGLSVPQRFALKLNEFRPELLTAAKSGAKLLVGGLPARIGAFLSLGFCRLSHFFGPEGTLSPEGLRAGGLALAAVAASMGQGAGRRSLAFGGTAPAAAVPVLVELLTLLDKLVYVMAARAEKGAELLRSLPSGGRSIAFLASQPPSASGAGSAAAWMPNSRVCAKFFLWGLPGFRASLAGSGGRSRALEISPGDLWLFPRSGSVAPALTFERLSGGAQVSPPPRWVEVWFFGDGAPPAAPAQADCGAMRDEIAARTDAIEALERAYAAEPFAAAAAVAPTSARGGASEATDAVTPAVPVAAASAAAVAAAADMAAAASTAAASTADASAAAPGAGAAEGRSGGSLPTATYRIEGGDSCTLILELASALSEAADAGLDPHLEDLAVDTSEQLVTLSGSWVATLQVRLPVGIAVADPSAAAAKLSRKRAELRVALRRASTGGSP